MNAPRVGGEVIDGEAVLIDFVSGAYFSLRGPGVVVWESLAEGGTADRAKAAVRRAHAGDEQAMDDYVERLVEALVAAELLVAADGEGAGADEPSAVVGDPVPFEPLPLEKFTDMEQLLLLDPIHEVDEAGWPVVPTE